LNERRRSERHARSSAASEAFALTHRPLARVIPDRRWARWAAQLLPSSRSKPVTAWLDAGQPDREWAAERIRRTIYAVIRSAAER
jgi:hypothetical protein